MLIKVLKQENSYSAKKAEFPDKPLTLGFQETSMLERVFCCHQDFKYDHLVV